jgi:hypothetical protein
MITVDEFKVILQKLYDNNFILINFQELYAIDAGGNMKQRPLYLPKGKRPLVLSLDDLNYYESMKGDGFANKLVLDAGRIRTQVSIPGGFTQNTYDGDVVPIVDAFVQKHPDFSFNGARGIIGVTGYDGILGYRTQLSATTSGQERVAVLPVVAALKKEGWQFANHSYSHSMDFLRRTISTTTLAGDIQKWKAEVEPLVGQTNIFIGPYGQVFSPHDPRRAQLISAGFNVLFGVGLDQYFTYFPTYSMQDRIDIDGYRLAHDERYLHTKLGI